MNRSTRLAPVIFAAGLSLLALPAWAQSSNSSPGSSSSNADRTRPGSSSSSSTLDSSHTGSSSTDRTRPGSSTSDSTFTPGASTNSSNSTTGSNVNTPRSGVSTGSSTGSQAGILNSNFGQIDADSDGRISLSEYTQSSVLNSGASANASTSVTGRSSTSGVTGGSQGQNSAEQFRQLDRNNDGYLSRDELNMQNNNRTGGRQP